jgi:hypothetical protein
MHNEGQHEANWDCARGWLCLLHAGEVAVLVCLLEAFRLLCEGKSRLLKGFTSLIFPHGGRKMRQRKLALSRQ